MTEYYVRRLPEWGTFQVAKFDGDSEPAAVYTLRGGAGKLKCDCPAYLLGRTRPCKHLPMVLAFIKAKESSPFLYQVVKEAA